MSKNKLVLILILVIAAFLRLYKLGSNPPSLNWDETAHGYNAYSILKTGRDEYGYKFPLFFRSFDDYKPPLYTYLVVPSVAIFGLNNFAVRFPSAILGVGSVLLTYLFVYELLKKKEIAYLSAFFLAISPWHLQFSRVAFETNSTIFFTLFGTWSFLKAIASEKFKFMFYMSLSAFGFGLNLFVYHNSRVFVPIFVIVLTILFIKKILNSKKYLIAPALIALIFSIALVPIIFSAAGKTRFEGTSIFVNKAVIDKSAQKIALDVNQGIHLVGEIVHNRRFAYLPVIMENYLSHFNPSFLFFNADMNRHHAPGIGLLYLWDLPFLLAGFFFLFYKKFEIKSKTILIVWFLLGPVAASVTWGVPHSLRIEVILPTFQIFIAIGFISLFKTLKSNKVFLSTTSILLILNIIYYLHQYYIHMPLEFSKDWLYGRQEAALYSERIKNNYDHVIVSTKLEQPHEFWLYYLKHDPKKYLEEGGTVSGGFLEDKNKFDKYEFKPINFEYQRIQGKVLFVGVPDEFPKDITPLKKINYLNGEPAIYIVSNI